MGTCAWLDMKPSRVFCLLLAVFMNRVHSYSSYQARIPNGDNVVNHAGVGHVQAAGGGARNSFGSAFANAGRSWTSAFCGADTDGDGKTNGDELGDPCCAGAVTDGSAVTAVYTNAVTDPSDSSYTTARTYCGTNTCGCTAYTCTGSGADAVAVGSGGDCSNCADDTFSVGGDTSCSSCPSGQVRASGDAECAVPSTSANGISCSAGSDCTSGNCVDSKCCSVSSCPDFGTCTGASGTCESCDGDGSAGTCALGAACSGHGSCATASTGQCTCDSGYIGSSCSQLANYTLAIVTTLGGYSKDSFDTATNRAAFKTAVAVSFASSGVSVSQIFITAIEDVALLLSSAPAGSALLSASVTVSYSIMNLLPADKDTIKDALAASDQTSFVANLKAAGLTEASSVQSPSSATEESAGNAGTTPPTEPEPSGTGTPLPDMATFNTVALHTDLSFKYRLESTKVVVQLILARGTGWVAVGTNPSSPNSMIGSRVTMGLPGGTTAVAVYDLTGMTSSQVSVSSKQDAISRATLTQTSDATVLAFTCTLGLKHGDGQLQFNAGENSLVWAFGGSNSKSRHSERGSMTVDLVAPGQVSNTTNSTGDSDDLYKSKAVIWLAHGVCMALAWGIMVPLGIIIARYFKGVPPSKAWFYRHQGVQMCAVVIAVAGLVCGVMGKGKTDAHFSTPHSYSGLFAMLVALMQPLAICLRGHKPAAGEQADTQRRLWECTHKWGGRLGAIAALFNVTLGTFNYSSVYIESGTGPNAVLAALFVGMVLIYMFGVYKEIQLRTVEAKDSSRKDSDASFCDHELHTMDSNTLADNNRLAV